MKFFVVSSFTNDVFCGNPAGVCLVGESWLPDEKMQQIAAQVNLSETAFVLRRNDGFFIRWFTPTVEVDLCGHATLAAACVMYDFYNAKELVFTSKKYVLPVEKSGERFVLDFPVAGLQKIFDFPNPFNYDPSEVYTANDEYLFVYENQAQIETAVCDLQTASNIDLQGFIITAPGDNGIDFASRYFAPKIGINEDPVTGSAHTILAPYWQKILGKNEFHARQLSKRGGELFCRIEGDRVKIAGSAVIFSRGEIFQ